MVTIKQTLFRTNIKKAKTSGWPFIFIFASDFSKSILLNKIQCDVVEFFVCFSFSIASHLVHVLDFSMWQEHTCMRQIILQKRLSGEHHANLLVLTDLVLICPKICTILSKNSNVNIEACTHPT